MGNIYIFLLCREEFCFREGKRKFPAFMTRELELLQGMWCQTTRLIAGSLRLRCTKGDIDRVMCFLLGRLTQVSLRIPRETTLRVFSTKVCAGEKPSTGPIQRETVSSSTATARESPSPGFRVVGRLAAEAWTGQEPGQVRLAIQDRVHEGGDRFPGEGAMAGRRVHHRARPAENVDAVPGPGAQHDGLFLIRVSGPADGEEIALELLEDAAGVGVSARRQRSGRR